MTDLRAADCRQPHYRGKLKAITIYLITRDDRNDLQDGI